MNQSAIRLRPDGAPLKERLRELRRSSQLLDVLWRVLTDGRGVLAIVILSSLAISALLAPKLAPYDPIRQLDDGRLLSPSAAHPFGTDHLSRDILSRCLFGLRITLAVSFGSVALGGIIGTTSGYIAGYAEGIVESVIMRLVDTMLAFPGLVMGIAVIAVLGASAQNVAIAIALANVPVFARLARAAVLAEKHRDYVLAARCIGASPSRILARHISINTLPPLIVHAALSVAIAVIMEATLGFIGLSVRPPTPTIGSIIKEGRGFLTAGAWYFVVFPTLFLSVILLSMNLLSDAILGATGPYRSSTRASTLEPARG